MATPYQSTGFSKNPVDRPATLSDGIDKNGAPTRLSVDWACGCNRFFSRAPRQTQSLWRWYMAYADDAKTTRASFLSLRGIGTPSTKVGPFFCLVCAALIIGEGSLERIREAILAARDIQKPEQVPTVADAGRGGDRKSK